ncbi:FAD-binding oxidoreductase [Castellaniella sp. FW104-16D08]|uniref:FAD-binding oxidoreductase n=1 Tax=unclassified Castellaniella TaxID=2617606 RepID=UPI0033147238
MEAVTRKRRFSGWGFEDQAPTREEIKHLDSVWGKYFKVDRFDPTPAPQADEITLRAPRVAVPDKIAHLCTVDHLERLNHCYGKSAHDFARMLRRDFSNPPDVIALPRNEQDVIDVLDWCDTVGAVAIPYGGGSSVQGGVTPPRDQGDRPVVTIDLRHLSKVLELDPTSQAARVQAGVYGPHLESQLKPSGFSLRFYPQSFEFSTLGGWIVTRAAGHHTTIDTQIDDLVESLRVVTPSGIAASRRIPKSGAGVSPDRLFIGSEGILGIVTEAWMRLRQRPKWRASAAFRFKDFYAGAEAVRALSQSGLYPSNCRLIDANEALVTGAGNGQDAILIVGFESADHPLDDWMKRASELCADHGGVTDAAGEATDSHLKGASGQWRNTFIRAPFFREHLTACGIMRETFETSVTWDKFKEFHGKVKGAIETAVQEVTGRPGLVTCRFTHTYSDGPAPYFTYCALGNKEKLSEQLWQIKTAASNALIGNGGTITHHHSIGRDHRQWYDQQRPEVFAKALRAAKQALDPKGTLNPGVLITP